MSKGFWSTDARQLLKIGLPFLTRNQTSNTTHALSPSVVAVSLQTLMETGRGERLGKGGPQWDKEDSAATEQVLMQVASFLKHELPIRLSHRISDLTTVPYMSSMPSVQTVRDWYLQSVTELASFPDIKVR